MLQTRVIPVLLLRNKGLVKTIKFKKEKYVGDPINAIKIFNDKEVDELILLDIDASKEKREPSFSTIEKIASECFMPVCYGGGISSIEQIKKIFELGIEKVSINYNFLISNELIKQAVKVFGSQSIVVSIDVKKNFFGKYKIYNHVKEKTTSKDIQEYLSEIEQLGVGELFVNSVDEDGMQNGYDLELLKLVTSQVTMPVIACGGAKDIRDFKETKERTNVSALAVGSLFVFHGKHKAVLISYPSYQKLREIFGEKE